jgi:hypothetical protein
MLQIARATLLHSGGPCRNAKAVDVVRVLQQIRDELAHHFTEEEASGSLDEVKARCPWLSGQVERVQAEHPDLLRGIDRLIAQTLDGEQTVEDRLSFERAFDELCENLYAHEVAEDDLLRQVVAIDPEDTAQLPIVKLTTYAERSASYGPALGVKIVPCDLDEASGGGKSHAQR